MEGCQGCTRIVQALQAKIACAPWREKKLANAIRSANGAVLLGDGDGLAR